MRSRIRTARCATSLESSAQKETCSASCHTPSARWRISLDPRTADASSSRCSPEFPPNPGVLMLRLILALSFVAVTAHAQSGSGTIDPGMTRAQVIERLGKPATVRTYQGSTYLMYSNKCGKKCGMQDLVILEHDSVVDAVLRSPERHYSGTSSSPEATAPNARTQRNQSLALPDSQSGAAERVSPGTQHTPADSA